MVSLKLNPWRMMLAAASFNLPSCAACAPVNAPRSNPNNSLSSRLSGIAAQLSVISGLAARLLCR
jgi:hypothetical protein